MQPIAGPLSGRFKVTEKKQTHTGEKIAKQIKRGPFETLGLIQIDNSGRRTDGDQRHQVA